MLANLEPLTADELFRRHQLRPVAAHFWQEPSTPEGKACACYLTANAIESIGFERTQKIVAECEDAPDNREMARIFATALGLTTPYCMGLMSGWDDKTYRDDPVNDRDYVLGKNHGYAARVTALDLWLF